MPEVWEGKHYENYESHNFNEYMIELGKSVVFFCLFLFYLFKKCDNTFILKNIYVNIAT